MRLRSTSFAFFFTLVATGLSSLAGCTADSADEDNLGQDEGEKRIKTKDSEALARFQANWPQGWQASVNQSDDIGAVSYRNANLSVGAATRFAEGDGCLSINTRFGAALQECGLAIAKNQLTSYELSSLKLAYDASTAGKLAADFGPKPTLTIKRKTVTNGTTTDQMIYTQPRGTAVSPYFTGVTTKGAIVLGGDYTFSWGLPIIDDVKQAIAKGTQGTVDLNPSDRRTVVKVKAPTRELPNAVPSACMNGNRNFIVQRTIANDAGLYAEPDAYSQRSSTEGAAPRYNSGEGIVAWRSLPLTQDLEMRMFPFASTEGAMHYEYIVNGVVVPIDAKPGKTVTINIERLDVDDVEVEKEDGSTYVVKGTYKVYRQGPNATWIPIKYQTSQYSDCSGNGSPVEFSAATGTGLDLPPGDYRLVIAYATAEGAKTKDQVVTLP